MPGRDLKVPDTFFLQSPYQQLAGKQRPESRTISNF
jgi:hypothetical protein